MVWMHLAWTLLAGTPALAGPTLQELDAQSAKLAEEGRFAEAETPALQALEMQEQALGTHHLDVAERLGNLGVLKLSRGDFGGAKPLYERSLAILEGSLGADHERVAASLNGLASALHGLDDLDGAQAMFERALAIQEDKLGSDHLELAAVLNNLARVHEARGEYPRALELFERALAIREKHLDPDHVEIGVVLVNLATLRWHMGDYRGGRAPAERGVAVLEKALDPEHPFVGSALNALALILMQLGDYDAALVANERILAIREHTQPEGHPDIGVACINLAVLLDTMGREARARALYERGIAIFEEALGPEHAYVGQVLASLGDLLAKQGDYVAARACIERALAIQVTEVGPDHPQVAIAHSTLGNLLARQGDADGARFHHERSVQIIEQTAGTDSARAAVAWSNLARVLQAQGDLEGARALFERALPVLEDQVSADHNEFATGLNNLGALLLELRDADGARQLLERSLAITEEALGPDHPEVAACLDNLGAAVELGGDPAAARTLHQRAIAIREKAWGPNHPSVAHSLDHLAGNHVLLGDLSSARPVLERSLAIRDQHLDLLDTLSEREALAYVADARAALDAWLSAVDDPADAELAWSHALRWKGAATRRLRARLFEAHDDPQVRVLTDQLQSVRGRLARVTFADYDPDRADQNRELQLQLTREKEDLERRLAQNGRSRGVEASAGGNEARDVCGALSNGTGLVDFLRSEDTYVAFTVVAPDCAVSRVSLDDADAVDQAIASWRRGLVDQAGAVRGSVPLVEVDTPSESVADLGVSVRQRVWDPLEASLAGAQRLIVVPDGALTAVPFAALPMADTGYLIERFPIATLDNAQDLLVAPSAPTGAGALLVGGVDFGAVSQQDVPLQLATRAAPCVDGTFSDLPGTKAEVESIATHWGRSRHRDEPVVKLTAADASERAVHQGLEGRRLVHLATHGFFATGQCRSALSRGGSGQLGAPSAVGYNPMLLSGVVLAGVNGEHDPRTGDDGILTAEELAGADLRGTELVVLSACETGLGEVRSGEGVLGLRRAFSAAGARHVVMSLWAVPDAATGELMSQFYAGALHRRRPLEPSLALRAAQLDALRRNRREEGAALPGQWAAFVASGVPSWGRATP